MKKVADEIKPYEEAPEALRLKVNKYYHKLMNSHPNMKKEQLLRACGKKFKIKLEEVHE